MQILGEIELQSPEGVQHAIEVQHRVYDDNTEKIALVQRTDVLGGHGAMIRPRPSYIDLIEFDPYVMLGMANTLNGIDAYTYLEKLVKGVLDVSSST